MHPLFTFIAHYDGNESAEQITAPSLESAISIWQIREFTQQITQPLENEFKEQMDWLFAEKDYVALDESVNIWYFSLLLGDELMNVHIVKTDAGQEVEKDDDMPGVAGVVLGGKQRHLK